MEDLEHVRFIDNTLRYTSLEKEEIAIKLNDESDFYSELQKYLLSADERKMLSERFSVFYTEAQKGISDGVENTDDSAPSGGSKHNYSPEDVDYTESSFQLITLYNYMTGYDGEEEPTIDMSPDFQRNFVWNDVQKSLLIESILLNIPIPAIYLNMTDDKVYIPADGLQRLNTIREFMSGKLALRGLEYLTELEGCHFKEDKEKPHAKALPRKQYRHFRDYSMTAFVINSRTPDAVKLDIFKRLNTTGTQLNAQEIRNSVTTKRIRQFYKLIEENEDFKYLISDNVNTNRFIHHEMILRYFGSYFWQVTSELEYEGRMNDFLDQVLHYLTNRVDDKRLEQLVDKYLYILRKARQLFGNQSFRKPPLKRRSSINTLLYSQVLISIENFEVDFSLEEGYLVEDFFNYLRQDQELILAISSSTNNLKNINLARQSLRDFFEGI